MLLFNGQLERQDHSTGSSIIFCNKRNKSTSSTNYWPGFLKIEDEGSSVNNQSEFPVRIIPIDIYSTTFLSLISSSHLSRYLII